jgi:hypothetical protein
MVKKNVPWYPKVPKSKKLVSKRVGQPTWVSVLEDVEPTGRKQFLTLFADGSQRVANRLESRRGEWMAYFNHGGKTLVKWGVVAWMDCPEPMKLSERNKIVRKIEKEMAEWAKARA